MYADFTRMMMPAQVLSTVAAQGRAALALQKQAYDWQLAQVKAAQKQGEELFAMGLDNGSKAFEAMQAAQARTLDSMTGEEQAEA